MTKSAAKWHVLGDTF